MLKKFYYPRLGLALALLCLWAAACNGNESAPAVTALPATDPTVSAPTMTPLPPASATSTITPAPVASPTNSPEPVATETITPRPASTLAGLTLAGPNIDYAGLSFYLDPAVAGRLYVPAEEETPGRVELSFAPEGRCPVVGCVLVRPVAEVMETIEGPIVTELQEALETGREDYFPTIGAAILVLAQTEPIDFGNGRGLRALVMRGQDLYPANNEALIYDFRGQTDDGQYYIIINVPLNAPILLDGYDPEENTNEKAIPLPELPEGVEISPEILLEYNEEVEQQLALLELAEFTPDMALLDALVQSLRVFPGEAAGEDPITQ